MSLQREEQEHTSCGRRLRRIPLRQQSLGTGDTSELRVPAGDATRATSHQMSREGAVLRLPQISIPGALGGSRMLNLRDEDIKLREMTCRGTSPQSLTDVTWDSFVAHGSRFAFLLEGTSAVMPSCFLSVELLLRKLSLMLPDFLGKNSTQFAMKYNVLQGNAFCLTFLQYRNPLQIGVSSHNMMVLCDLVGFGRPKKMPLNAISSSIFSQSLLNTKMVLRPSDVKALALQVAPGKYRQRRVRPTTRARPPARTPQYQLPPAHLQRPPPGAAPRSSAASLQREALGEVSVNTQQPLLSAAQQPTAVKAAGDARKEQPTGDPADGSARKAEGIARGLEASDSEADNQSGTNAGKGGHGEAVVTADVSNPQLLQTDIASPPDHPDPEIEGSTFQIESHLQNEAPPGGEGGFHDGRSGERRVSSSAASKRGRDWAGSITGSGAKKRSMGGGRWSTAEEQAGERILHNVRIL
ncbi:hypothetical protein KFL_002390050 [Klebsormidium nitens]|uniref:Uncharacterized protein n=1 Tax=Klebsormidium nitens TaxID=105231 RepID=A0A1Y1I6D4_KLENI|nr:hypothetical protein KFL_002390050 [Klebsormidium nitens]|eukprot:GAQ85512.1 hypothetical protein KFL_002390050 [Klebsormidium nitens]